MNTKAQNKLGSKEILKSDDSFEILKNLQRAQDYHKGEMAKFQAKVHEHQRELREVVKAIKIYERKTGDRQVIDIPYKEEIRLIFKNKNVKLSASEATEVVLNKYKIVGKGLSWERAQVRSQIYTQLTREVSYKTMKQDKRTGEYSLGKGW